MSKILILSNGHGEDLSGCLLAKKLIQMGYEVDALPIVGNGDNYRKNKVKIVCKTREFNTGGLGYNSLKGRIDDVFNGQIIYFLRKLLLTFLIRKKYEYFLVVGDIVPILFAWICRNNFFVYLVAYSSHYEGKLSLPWPCRLFLRSKKMYKLYTRDSLTAFDLSKQISKKVCFLGNPFMDPFINQRNQLIKSEFNIVFLPGSRMPEVLNNFSLMIDLLEQIAQYKYFRNAEFSFAIIKAFTKEKLIQILSLRNWNLPKKQNKKSSLEMRYKNINVKFNWNAFEETLICSDLVISMAGTATEQAIGLQKPVIQLEGCGPQFTSIFAEAQRRLLGNYIFCVTNYREKNEKIEKTINLILKILYFMKLDSSFLKNCKKNANQRIGESGASNKISIDINNIINSESRLN